MKSEYLLGSALLSLALLVGCDLGPKSGRGFAFPEGNSARGQKAFVELKCATCHRVDGVPDLPVPTIAPEKVVLLGGDVLRLRTYGDLVTSVIHPAYARTMGAPGRTDKDPAMPAVNEAMTVGQLLDIVTFLHPHYRKLQPLYSEFTNK